MTIDQIREIVISPDAIMRKEWGKVLLNEIDRLTKELEEASSVIEMFRLRAEKAEADNKRLRETYIG